MRILRFLKALAKYILSGKTVSNDVYKFRLNICNVCKDKCGKTCCICGCYINKKAKWSTESCPKNKW